MKRSGPVRVFFIVLLAIVMLFSATACIGSGQNRDGSAAESQTTQPTDKPSADKIENGLNSKASLKVWFSMNTDENEALQKIADAFTKETGVKVEVLDSNFFTIRQKFPAAAKTSQGPDIVYMQSADLGALAESGYLRTVDWLDKETKERFYPIGFDGMSYNGKLYGLGYSVDAYGIVYNKRLVKTLPKTWAEFFSMGEQLTVRDSSGKPATYGILMSPSNYWFMYPIIKNYGGYYFGQKSDGSYNPEDIGIDNAGTAAAVKKLLEMKGKGLTTQVYTEIDTNVSQKFSEGKVAMFVYGLWDAQKYKDTGIDYGYAPLPANDNGTKSKPLATVQGFVLNKHSKWAKESDAFLKYIMQDPNQQKLYEAGNGGKSKSGARNTCSRAVVNSPYVQSSELLKSLVAVGLTGEVFPANPEATVIWNSSTAAFNAIYFKNAPVEAKLKELAAKVRSDIVKMRK